MKVALISTGLGQVWRGYERFTNDLFYLLKDKIDITLFKGGGEAKDREIIVPHFSRDGILSKLSLFKLPLLRNTVRGNAYYFEALSFFCLLLPRLISGKYDLVHFTDCPLANFFYHVSTKLNIQYRFKTLFTNGNPITDGACRRVDFLQELTPWQTRLVADSGVPNEKIITLPFGIHCQNFIGHGSRQTLRAQYGIPSGKKVILAVSAINRTHKRIDYLIHEIAQLGEDYFLLVAGHLEDSSLENQARQLLGNRFRFLHVPFEEVNQLYQLADIFTQCSLVEGFGLSLVEAMSARVPVIVPSTEHYEWMVGSKCSLTDLSVQGNLARRIKELMADEKGRLEMITHNYENAVQRFDWVSLKDQYLEMYDRVLRQELQPTG
ncbi:MAG: hypothetical protein A3C35_07240 [Omnitrophica bacterium RIFCSPHIGHO2_02_FULL_46_11]|nr:MAG: hypothetical protein A3C35_07240 [Omnitrophica bacterium RIFCSPHIGHO2_02_FULL_46_11]OGW87382.1 MAG: hypothetical protein A3A81_04650 [Omnitrophica bacterium RIFCSPLOWO2_01_FULL_45_10b]